MKDETFDVPIKGFVGLKSKGINKKVADDELKYEDCKNVLFSRSYVRHEMNTIQGKDHNIGPYKINKIYVFLR